MRYCCKVFAIVFLMTLWLATELKAQKLPIDPARQQAQLSSPYETTYSFLYFLQSDSYQIEEALRTLNKPDGFTQREVELLAKQLREILEDERIYQQLDSFPKTADYYDSLSRVRVFRPFDSLPEIYLFRNAGSEDWLFSANTLRAVRGMYRQKFPDRARQREAGIDLSSPYHTLYTFVSNLRVEDFEPDVAAYALDADEYSERDRMRLAVKLKQILDGKGIVINLEKIPRQPYYRDTVRGQEVYVISNLIPDVYLIKKDRRWLFSAETVARIDRLHNEVYPFGLDTLLSIVPKRGHYKILGIELWKYIGIGIMLLGALLLHKALNYLFGFLIVEFLHRYVKIHLLKRFIADITRPLSLWILFQILYALIPIFQLPVNLTFYLMLFLRISLPIFVVMILYNLINALSAYLERITARTANTLDDQLLPLARKTLKIIVVSGGVLFVLDLLNFNITALLAGLSIGGIAFALAAQDTIKNLFGSITIFVDRPFQVGDWIVGDRVDGLVEEIGFRSTRVRTFNNSLIYIPNGRLADMTIDNMGMRIYRRYNTKLAITYDTPPELIEAFVYGLRKLIELHPQTRKDLYHVYFNEFGSDSLNILFVTFFPVPDFTQEHTARQELNLSILKLAKELGIRFAFPTQTLHIEEVPGQESLTPQYGALENNALRQQVDQWITVVHQQNGKGKTA
jgi:MscS family membrane protein